MGADVRGVRRAIAVVLAGCAVVAGLVVLFEEKLIYFPSRELLATPSDLSLDHEDVELRTEDGLRLHAWFLRANGSEAPATILYCHGNAGNVSHRLTRAAEMIERLGTDVFLFDYRGYGRSEGSPDEMGTYRDGRAAYHYLVGERSVPPDRVVLYGESLGAAVAVALAAEAGSAAGALVLEAPFTSIAEMARHHYPFLPFTFLVRTEYDNLTRIRNLELPLLVVHGTADEVVPFEHGRRLFEAASEPKRFLAVVGAGHGDAPAVAGGRYWSALRELILGSRAR